MRRSTLIMPFGKHKGDPIEDIPVAYLTWCLENLDSLGEEIRTEMENQIRLKAGKGVWRKGEH